MKLLIVDDEQHVIKAIKFLINATKLHINTILEASCVQDAISIIRNENPELIITDVVMDDFTGIDLMEYINSLEMYAKVIVVSGYNEYNYIRSTLQHGGIDYLLKPIDGSQLNSALEKAIGLWHEDNKNHMKSQKMIDSMCDICKESLLYKLITQPLPDKYYEEFIRILPSLKKEHSVMLGYSSLKYWGIERNHENHHFFLQLHMNINELLEGANCGFCFSPPDTDYEFYIFVYQEHIASQAKIQHLLESWHFRYRVPFTVGFSYISAFPEEVHTLKEQAEQAFLSQTICARDKLLISYAYDTPQPVLSDLTAEENHLFSSVITGNEAMIDASIQEFLSKAFSSSQFTLTYMVEFTDYYNSLLKQWKKRLNEYYTHIHVSECSPLQYSHLLDENYQLSLPLLQQQIKKHLLHYANGLTAQKPDSEHNTIYQIAHYIELNYTKPYNQLEYARLFFINKDYMCRKFKSTFHVNMVSYITSLRLNKAKELLVSSDLKIRDIAQAVGFEDEKYFSRRFNREIGMSPNEYRTRHTLTNK